MLKNQKRERKEVLQRTRTEETFNKQQLVLGTIVICSLLTVPPNSIFHMLPDEILS